MDIKIGEPTPPESNAQVTTAEVQVTKTEVAQPDIKTAAEETLKKVTEQINPPKSKGKIMKVVVIGTILAGLVVYMAPNALNFAKERVRSILAPQVAVQTETRPETKYGAPALPPINDPLPEPPGPAPMPLPIAPIDAKVEEIRSYYIRLAHQNGKIEVRTGGSTNWRLNNPCTILQGPFSASQHAIKTPGTTYAVFETYDAGRLACYNMLFGTAKYKTRTVSEAMELFAPADEGFKPSKYLSAMKKAGININSTMSQLSEPNRQALIDTIMKVEDFIDGRVLIFNSAQEFKEKGY